jgi:BASS family bile acid:Na+ symporter
MATVELLYGTLLVVALVLNGIALTGATPLRPLFAPLRESRLVLGILVLDLVVIPLAVIGGAHLLDVSPVTRAALVIVAAASCGPIGIALTRLARGDVALGVTLVAGLGALNLVTTPIFTGLFLPSSITIPLSGLLINLVGLVIAPLILGRAYATLAARRGTSAGVQQRTLTVIRRLADIALLGAIMTAATIDVTETLRILTGPVLPIALGVMLVVTLGARLITADAARIRTIAVTMNARAVGLALTIAALQLSDVPDLRATILAFGGLTQVVPLVVVLLARWVPRRLSPQRTG